jgi:hypothetical protein
MLCSITISSAVQSRQILRPGNGMSLIKSTIEARGSLAILFLKQNIGGNKISFFHLKDEKKISTRLQAWLTERKASVQLNSEGQLPGHAWEFALYEWTDKKHDEFEKLEPWVEVFFLWACVSEHERPRLTRTVLHQIRNIHSAQRGVWKTSLAIMSSYSQNFGTKSQSPHTTHPAHFCTKKKSKAEDTAHNFRSGREKTFVSMQDKQTNNPNTESTRTSPQGVSQIPPKLTNPKRALLESSQKCSRI